MEHGSSPSLISPGAPAEPQRTAPWLRAAAGANLRNEHGGLEATIFEEITSLAQATGAINLGQGFPDTDGPDSLKEAAVAQIRGDANQYAPGKGLLGLREAIASHQQRFYGIELNPDREVVVTTGATEAIAATILAFCGPGDEVVTFEPFYDSYGAMIALSGARHRTIPIPQAAPGSLPFLQPAPEAIAAAFSPATRLVILNNPHNPTGLVFDRPTLEAVVAQARLHGALILSDEVYEHLVFDAPHLPVASLPGAWERTITVSSAGKTFSVTGWKVGWASGSADLMDALRTVKQFLSYSSGGPFQLPVAEALAAPEEYFLGIAAALRERGTLLSTALEAIGLPVSSPQAGYFVVADAAPLGIGGTPGEDARNLARDLPGLIGVAAIPVSVFCHEEGAQRTRSLLRFAFCKKTEVLEKAARRLAALPALLADRTDPVNPQAKA
ncbi:aminotransferase class I/II-fold pyridoxal phosphate-dependent enzyme [Psychromicrobium xiongbiense]|uniref:aminotransferase class I/II-fold pyridoxal phosphate-dependent enzyme n=1 Tax=Psychromicrobium xiongbiense TaxID=3051184 RepID=UPI002556FEB1|nr:aminotransferase class I/II-fold pyridoxal phosphate-dependent enzyme [Psychromicrobium sp. YIM S02556]